MKILAIEKENCSLSLETFKPLLAEEARAVWELYKKNILREIYFRDDQNTAVLMLECGDVREAETVLSQLPLVKEGLIHFELLPLKPYPGFERLFISD